LKKKNERSRARAVSAGIAFSEDELTALDGRGCADYDRSGHASLIITTRQPDVVATTTKAMDSLWDEHRALK